MDPVTLYRFALGIVAGVGIGLNVVAAFLFIHCGRKKHLPLGKAHILGVLGAVGTLCISAFFRLRDWNSDWPLNVGDYTALVPIAFFTAAGYFAVIETGRSIGRRPVTKDC